MEIQKRFEALRRADREKTHSGPHLLTLWGSIRPPGAPPPPPSASSIANRLDDNHYPRPEKAPVKRERCFSIRKVPESTVQFTLNAVKEVHPNAAPAIANTKLFHEFEEKNDVPRGTLCRSLLLLLFIIDITVQGLGLSSARTYAHGILGVEERAGRPIEGPYISDMFKILELLISAEEVDHAKDIDIQTANDILRRLTGQAQVVVWLMIVTGARVQDLLRMRRKQFNFVVLNGVAHLHVHFRYTKNRHQEKMAYTLKVQLTDDIRVPKSVADYLRSLGSESPIITMDAGGLNRAIDKLGEAFKEYTSYSFRRFFVHRAIIKYKDQDGYVAWVEVVKLTGHVRIETLRTSYAHTFDRTL